LSIRNSWAVEAQLTVTAEDYVYYQDNGSSETAIARAIEITGDINTSSNE
jgi:hypothetical protein